MTRAQIVQEIIDRGYNYVKPSRIGDFVDRAYGFICSRRSWPFLEQTLEGTAPLEVASLRKVTSVVIVDRQVTLQGASLEWLQTYYPDLTQTGPATFWYLDGDTIKVYPTSEEVLKVRVLKREAALADGDEPLFSEEWQSLLIDLAVVECLKDDDEYEEAAALRKLTIETIDTEMTHALLNRNLANSRMVKRTGAIGDYA